MLNFKPITLFLFLILSIYADTDVSKSQNIAGWSLVGSGCILIGSGVLFRYLANEIYYKDLDKPMTFEETYDRTRRTVGANCLNLFSVPIIIGGTVLGTIGIVKTFKYYKKRKANIALNLNTNIDSIELELVYKW